MSEAAPAANPPQEPWQASIAAMYGSMSPRTRKTREDLRAKYPLRIWVGGPGTGSPLCGYGQLLEPLLRAEGCEVVVSQGGHTGTALGEELVELAGGYDLLLLLAASPGASAEAMELALWQRTRDMLHVFVPEEYRQGYLARSLDERHGVLCALSYFPLEDAQRCGTLLPRNIVNTVFKHRCALEQKHAVQSQQQVATSTQINIGNLMVNGDIFNVGSGATVINRAWVNQAFNAVQARYDLGTAEAIKAVSEHVAKSGSKEAVELMDAFNEEVAKAAPKKSVLKGLWEGLCKVLPTVTEMAKATGEIAKVFAGPGQS